MFFCNTLVIQKKSHNLNTAILGQSRFMISHMVARRWSLGALFIETLLPQSEVDFKL